QVDHTHLFKAALNDARARRALLQFLEMQAVNDFLGDSHQVFDQKRFGDEVFYAVHEGTKTLFDVRTAGHEQKWNVARLFSAAQLFKELAAVKAGHFVVAKNGVRRFVDDFKQSVGAVFRNQHFAMRLKTLRDDIAHKRIIVREQQPNF